MKQTHSRYLIVVFLIMAGIIFFMHAKFKKESSGSKLNRDFNEIIVKLPNKNPLNYENKVFEKIEELSNRDVIAMGEASHGVKEFFELKHRLFKYLVENCEVKVLAYEISFEKSLEIDKYITSGIGNIDSLLSQQSWIQSNKEVSSLIEWMKSYNESICDKEKIHFIGIDSQLDAYNVEDLINNIISYDENIYYLIAELLYPIVNKQKIKYKEMSPDDYMLTKTIFNTIKNRVSHYFVNDSEYKLSYNEKLILQLIDCTIQSHEFLYINVSKNKNLRDRHLAENVIWCKNLLGENAKIAVWAHNVHVSVDPEYYTDSGCSMGYYLKNEFNDNYFVIGTSFSKGKFKAGTAESLDNDTEPKVWELLSSPPENSVNNVLINAKYPNYFFYTKDLQKDSLDIFFNHERPFLGIGDFYSGNADMLYKEDKIQNVKSYYDIIFNYSFVNPSTLLRKGL